MALIAFFFVLQSFQELCILIIICCLTLFIISSNFVYIFFFTFSIIKNHWFSLFLPHIFIVLVVYINRVKIWSHTITITLLIRHAVMSALLFFWTTEWWVLYYVSMLIIFQSSYHRTADVNANKHLWHLSKYYLFKLVQINLKFHVWLW